MWLNAFHKGKKILSPIELLILATVTEEELSAKEISNNLIQNTGEWQPAPGTVYPVLNRLSERGLLERTKGNRINFRRTLRGNIFLSSILKPLQVQAQETNLFYLAIIESILKVSPVPIGIHQFMEDMENLADTYQTKIQALKEEASTLKDESVDVPISFD